MELSTNDLFNEVYKMAIKHRNELKILNSIVWPVEPDTPKCFLSQNDLDKYIAAVERSKDQENLISLTQRNAAANEYNLRLQLERIITIPGVWYQFQDFAVIRHYYPKNYSSIIEYGDGLRYAG